MFCFSKRKKEKNIDFYENDIYPKDIQITKGRVLRAYDPRKIMRLVFEYRKHEKLYLDVIENDCAPFMGCKVDKQSAILIRDFMNKCIEDTRNDCCWDFEFQKGFVGTYTCPKCNQTQTNENQDNSET